jgi:hypothetical protein
VTPADVATTIEHCKKVIAPPDWAIGLIAEAIRKPATIFLWLALSVLLYVEFLRRSFRSPRTERFLVSSPWEFFAAIGATVSRYLRPLTPVSDKIGNAVAFSLAIVTMLVLAYLFAKVA